MSLRNLRLPVAMAGLAMLAGTFTSPASATVEVQLRDSSSHWGNCYDLGGGKDCDKTADNLLSSRYKYWYRDGYKPHHGRYKRHRDGFFFKRHHDSSKPHHGGYYHWKYRNW